MKTILVLAEHPDFAEAVRAALDPERYRVVHRADLTAAEPLLSPQFLDACVLDLDLTLVQQLWTVEKLQRRLPRCPLLIYTSAKKAEWEEEAYLHGARQVLLKPVRPRLLSALVERLWTAETPAPPTVVPSPPPAVTAPATDTAFLRATPFQALETLSALRDFSAILGDSLCAEALLRQFLLRLREVLGVNRAAIFLLQTPPAPAPAQGRVVPGQRVLRAVCAVGVAASLVEDFELSLDAGIGGFLHRHGRILRRDGPEAQAEPATLREFELLGAQFAIPIFDREALIGVAVLDGRVTGDPIANAELRLIFHLLEAIGLAVKNIWLHDQLSTNHEMLADVLRQFSSGCVVVGQDLAILHANKAARSCFAAASRFHQTLEFSDLPEELGRRIYQVLRTGNGTAPFTYTSDGTPKRIFQASIVPVQSRTSVLPSAALMIIEDQTQAEQLRRLEIEASNLRLVKQMADRLAHEVGNALVPLSTHQQLFAKKYSDPEFRSSLDNALTEGVRRVTRLINQMRFLARDAVDVKDVFPLAPLLEEAYQEAQKYQPVKAAQLKYNLGDRPVLLAGDRASLKHAFAEILLNALQANPAAPRISVSMTSEPNGNGVARVRIEFRDNGAGFPPDVAARVPEPFFTTRNVGLGLGLVVSSKVAESHQGRLEIVPAAGESPGVVRLVLPLAPATPEDA